MGQAGKKHIEENFSLKGMVDQTVNIYHMAMRSANNRYARKTMVGSH
jgi:hypothetical protein